MAVFGFCTTSIVWLALKKTIGIRVSREEELQGLDIGEHGNIAYPDFAPAAEASELSDGRMPLEIPAAAEPAAECAAADSSAPAAGAASFAGAAAGTVSAEEAVPVVHLERQGQKMTKVTVITNQSRFSELESALEKLGVTGLTITNVFGYGMQKGHTLSLIHI